MKRFGGGGCFGLEVNLVCTVGENLKRIILKGEQSEPMIFWREISNISFSIKSLPNLTNFTYIAKPH